MKNNAPFGMLALSSLRLNTGFLLAFGLALIFILTSFWAIWRLLEDQEERVNFHFLQVMDNTQEQQAFLQSIADKIQQPNADLAYNPDVLKRIFRSSSAGLDIYEASERSFSLPYTVAESHSLDEHKLDLVIAMGWHLANAYSRFWAGSHYQSPQVLLFSPDSRLKIAVPAIEEWRDESLLNLGNYVEMTEAMFARTNADRKALGDGQVHWTGMASELKLRNVHQALSYVGITIPDDQFRLETGLQKLILVSVFDLNRLNSEQRKAVSPFFDLFTLITPANEVLLGERIEGAPERAGLTLTSQGLLITAVAKNTNNQRWTAQYLQTYGSFFRWATWPLLQLLAGMVTLSATAWWYYHWYRTKVVFPARDAQRQLIESTAFSQAVIDSAPAGLCVIRQRDDQVVLENRHAQKNSAMSQAIIKWLHKPDIPLAGEVSMEEGERYYLMNYALTRYQGEEVSLCVFSDVTEHQKNSIALRQAKLKADQASEAKSTFLATMSHEIRTPLYGVLGTLELLGLTHLDQRQRDYLQVIQRSSSTLLQLISDVLDVSKIEAGQLALESASFCPLDLAEDALSAHVANAGSKGLQIYACIDADVPDLLYGDQMRIWQILNNLLSNAIKFTDIGRIVLRGKVIRDDPEHVLLEYQVTDTGIGISQEQQHHLFDPFYQARSSNQAGGTGLGLSICSRFSQLMDGEIRVVSEPGLGSSFSVILPLRKMVGSLPDSDDLILNTNPVYVHAPVRELAENISQWLNRWGASARVVSVTAQEKFAETLLIDVLGSADRLLPWNGDRLICEADGPQLPECSETGWRVGAHHVRAIARGVLQIQENWKWGPLLEKNHNMPNLALRVLVAEDNPINQGILKEQLEALGCAVVLASDGLQAMQLWEPGAFDVVLTDINMPVMNGYLLAQSLREKDAELNIIGVTANAMREEGDRCEAAGMTSWMVKPLSLSTLRAQLLKIQPVSPIMPAPLEPPDSLVVAYKPESLVLSESMRSLFMKTMEQDIASTRRALADNDSVRVRETIHGLCGALAVVRAEELSHRYGQLEHRLIEKPLDAALALDIEQGLVWLSSLLKSLDDSTPAR